LADRIIVLDQGVVALEQVVPQPRPRPRGSADLAAIEGAILAHLMSRRAGPTPMAVGEPR
jgi:sulfonate transport system ATP-binding protein